MPLPPGAAELECEGQRLSSGRLRVLIVTQYFRPESFRINDLVDALVERGHEVTVATGMPNYPSGRFPPGFSLLGPYRERQGEVEVLRFPLIPRGRGGRVRLALNYLSFAFMASLLAPLRCRGSYDVIFVFEPSPITVGLPAIVLRRLRGIPAILWVQDLWPESVSATGAIRSPRLIRWIERLVRLIYDHCDEILVQSEAFVGRVRELAGGEAIIRYFPNWAESGYRAVVPQPEEAAELPSGFRIVFAGNIGVAQSFETILSAAERLQGTPEIQWLIFGDGRQRPTVEQAIRERSLSGTVHLLGQRPFQSMPEYLALADALLVTLRRDPVFSLTIPSKIQSYLACGRPILAALDGEGARILTESGAGVVASAEDSEGLAEGAIRLYRMSSDQRETMGRCGRDYFEGHFDRDKLVDRLEGWMRDLARRPACAS